MIVTENDDYRLAAIGHLGNEKYQSTSRRSCKDNQHGEPVTAEELQLDYEHLFKHCSLTVSKKIGQLNEGGSAVWPAVNPKNILR